MLISDHRNLTTRKWQGNMQTENISISLICRIHRHGSITKQCLWSRCRNYNITITFNQWIFNLIQRPILVFIFNLNIRKSRLMLCTIIY